MNTNKSITSLLILLFITVICYAQTNSNGWPVLKTYDQDHIQKIKTPVGGIGTGIISLTGRGSLEDWKNKRRCSTSTIV